MAALFTQHLRDGDQVQAQKQRLINQISQLIIDNKHEYTWTMAKYDKSKTTAQVNYYFGVVVKSLMEAQGLTKEEADNALRNELLTPTHSEAFGKIIETRPRVKYMKLRPMSVYIDSCVLLLGTYGVLVSPPPYKHCEE